MASSLETPINGKAVLRARLLRGWTQRELAERCAELGQPYDDTLISKVERGRVERPGPKVLRVLTEALGLDMDELLTPESKSGNGDGAAA